MDMGGDQFFILCRDSDALGAAYVATKLLGAVASRFLLAQQVLAVTVLNRSRHVPR